MKQSRRDFLKAAGGAGAGLLLGPLFSSAAARAALAADDTASVRGASIMSFEPGLLRVRALSPEPAVTLGSGAFKDGRIKLFLSNISPSRLDVKCDAKTQQTAKTEIMLETGRPAGGNLIIETSYRAPGGRLDFIAFSDTHLGDPEAEEHFACILKHANHCAPMFAVNAGDNVDVDETAQWNIFAERTAGLDMPLFATIGNHDSYFATKLYRKYLGGLYYSFTILDSQLLMLDNSQTHNNATLFMDGRNPGAQWDWLEKQLQAPAKHRFAFFHFPMYGTRSMTEPMYMVGTKPEKRAEEVARLERVFRDTGVKYVCFGHLHSPERTEKDGLVFLRLGGGGGSRASHTEDKDVSFAHIFADEKGIRDYTIFMYGGRENISSIEFREPPVTLPRGERARILVHGVSKDGRLIAVEAETKFVSGHGGLSGNVFSSGEPGPVKLEARYEGLSASCEFTVI